MLEFGIVTVYIATCIKKYIRIFLVIFTLRGGVSRLFTRGSQTDSPRMQRQSDGDFHDRRSDQRNGRRNKEEEQQRPKAIGKMGLLSQES